MKLCVETVCRNCLCVLKLFLKCVCVETAPEMCVYVCVEISLTPLTETLFIFFCFANPGLIPRGRRAAYSATHFVLWFLFIFVFFSLSSDENAGGQHRKRQGQDPGQGGHSPGSAASDGICFCFKLKTLDLVFLILPFLVFSHVEQSFCQS